ncbi:MAG: ATP-binding protein [Candidatus Woesebacteria bacterium]|nr:ATP-binding protein [Candidatus Woesebacteria bacterium]
MFKEARIKLTGWYLLIIMAISLSFSVAIYAGVNRELTRIGDMQKARQERVDTISNFLRQNGLPVPPEVQSFDSEAVEQARLRIISALGLINISILVLSGLGGYLLAGLTLDPISKMVKKQKEFVGNASHELRTPLTSLKTEIEVALRDKKLDLVQAKNIFRSNLEDVDSMQRLSNYLLEQNRYENSDIDLEIKKVDLAGAVTRAIKKAEPVAGKKKIKIVSRLQKVMVNGNEDALIELSTILIENAIKYSGKSKSVEVKTGGKGTFEVKDFGIGIPPADIPHIFERFYRAESSRSKEKIDGYGLGLSIAKSIVDKLGGKIKVNSKLGQGTTFSVQFPAA